MDPGGQILGMILHRNTNIYHFSRSVDTLSVSEKLTPGLKLFIEKVLAYICSYSHCDFVAARGSCGLSWQPQGTEKCSTGAPLGHSFAKISKSQTSIITFLF